MSDTLLRLGLWILIVVLGLFIVAEMNHDEPWAELIPHQMLQQALVLGVLLIAAGIVFAILGKGARKIAKNRCQVCRTPIATGAIYCRAHLRSILDDEDDRTHATRIR